jgi:cystathionine beta-synthase
MSVNMFKEQEVIESQTINSGVLDQIGHTPLIKLPVATKDADIKFYGKCEYLNPGGSIKDRAAKYMIEHAEKTGLLKPNGVIVEGSSGNQGIALAMIGALKGYKVIITVPNRTSSTKVNTLKAYGARVYICDEEGEHGYVEVAREIALKTPGAFMPDQYYNPINSRAHYVSTGPDIWRQTKGEITHFIAAMGTCGTICGVASYLKEQNPNIKIWGVDAKTSVRSAHHFNQKNPHNLVKPKPYKVEGIGVDVLDGIYNPSLIDKISCYSDEDIFAMTKSFSKNHGMLVGFSSAAVLKMLEDNLGEFKGGEYVVAILADSGRNYLDKIDFC